MLHKPNRKIIVIYKHKCLQRSRDIVNLYSEHLYGCRFAIWGQDLEINIASHNSERGVRKNERKVRKSARNLAIGQGANKIGIANKASRWETNCVIVLL